MKVTVLRPVEIEATAIRCVFQDLGRDAEPDEIESWRKAPGWSDGTFVLDLDTRKVRGWPEGLEVDIFAKVVDTGSFDLLGLGPWRSAPPSIDPVTGQRDSAVERREEQIATLTESYVPSCVPREFGDYLALKVAADGTVIGWAPTARDVKDSFFPDGVLGG